MDASRILLDERDWIYLGLPAWPDVKVKLQAVVPGEYVDGPGSFDRDKLHCVVVKATSHLQRAEMFRSLIQLFGYPLPSIEAFSFESFRRGFRSGAWGR